MKQIDIFYYCYNQEEYVVRALNSISIQNYDGTINLYISDDGSKDNSLDLIRKWIQKHECLLENFNIKLIRGADSLNKGQSATLLEGLYTGKSNFLCILEGDDYWISNDHIASLERILEKFDFAPAAFSSWISMNSLNQIVESRIRRPGTTTEEFLSMESLAERNPPGTLSAMIFRREALNEIKKKLEAHQNVADYVINLYLSVQGPIYWSENISLNYFAAENSIWRSLDSKKRLEIQIQQLRTVAQTLEGDFGQFLDDVARRLTPINVSFKLIWALYHPIKAVVILKNRLWVRILKRLGRN